jgi:hypothetical protein
MFADMQPASGLGSQALFCLSTQIQAVQPIRNRRESRKFLTATFPEFAAICPRYGFSACIYRVNRNLQDAGDVLGREIFVKSELENQPVSQWE